MVIFKTTSIHTKRRVTLDAFEYYGSRHAPRWTHATTLLLGVADRPVLIVTCVQSSDVSRSWGWSPYRHGWLWLMPRPCQHLSDKVETKISVKFSSHHLKIKGCICWQWPGLTGGKRAFGVEGKVSTGRIVAVDLSHYQHHHHLQSCWRKIWAWRLWYWRPSWRWAWLVLHVLRIGIFLLVAVWIHYDFLHLIRRQQTNTVMRLLGGTAISQLT